MCWTNFIIWKKKSKILMINELIWANMSSSVHVDNKGKDILILGEGPTQGLNHALTAEAKYPINFTQSRKTFVLSLLYNGSNGFLFVNVTKIYQFKAN